MCGRYGLTRYPSGLVLRLGGKPQARAVARYNIAPTQPSLAILNDAARSERDLRFGLVPPFAANPAAPRFATFNARIETIATAPAYRDALRRTRCAILADGYYEWRKNSDGTKTPFWIARRDGEAFAFAGLWARSGRGVDALESCTIVTQPPNTFVAAIHSRMPVVLHEDAYDAWLSPEERRAPEMLALLAPQSPDAWTAHPVSARVGNVRNDDPSLVEISPDGAR